MPEYSIAAGTGDAQWDDTLGAPGWIFGAATTVWGKVLGANKYAYFQFVSDGHLDVLSATLTVTAETTNAGGMNGGSNIWLVNDYSQTLDNNLSATSVSDVTIDSLFGHGEWTAEKQYSANVTTPVKAFYARSAYASGDLLTLRVGAALSPLSEQLVVHAYDGDPAKVAQLNVVTGSANHLLWFHGGTHAYP